MPIETFNYLDSLDASNPPTSDGLVQGDDHIRGIKATLKSTLPGLVGAATRVIGAAWGFLAGDGSVTAPAFSFASESTLGAYRSAAATMTYTGVLRSAGDAGRVFMHAGATVPAGALVCDGQAVPRAFYSDLFAAIGTSWGAGDGSTTFNVPDLQDRFPRHRGPTYSGIVGTKQTFANGEHTHPVSGTTSTESVSHAHSFSGTTSFMTANQNHSHSYNNSNGTSSGVTGGGSFGLPINDTAGTTGAANVDHQHTFAGATGAEDVNHTHAFAVTSGTGSADGTETRPLSATLLFCIRY